MTAKPTFSWNAFQKAPIVGIIRGESIDTVRKIAIAYLNAELSTIEITMNTKGADEIILRTNRPAGRMTATEL